MGIFDSIKHAIFGEAKAETLPQAPSTPATPAPAPADARAAPTASAPSVTPSSAPAVVDVTAILDQAVQASGQKLDWKHSIVDLLKALKIDSSLSARKELATELGYSGDGSDSAAMNIWLHKAVIKKLSENGGQVPAELLD